MPDDMMLRPVGELATLFSLARQVQRAADWTLQRPAVSA